MGNINPIKKYTAFVFIACILGGVTYGVASLNRKLIEFNYQVGSSIIDGGYSVTAQLSGTYQDFDEQGERLTIKGNPYRLQLWLEDPESKISKLTLRSLKLIGLNDKVEISILLDPEVFVETTVIQKKRVWYFVPKTLV